MVYLLLRRSFITLATTDNPGQIMIGHAPGTSHGK